MAWIESHQSLREHPKLYQLCEGLSILPPQAIGHLHLVWWWVVDYAPSGDLSRYSISQIEKAAQWAGEPGALVGALVKTGFFERADDVSLLVHDWQDFCGELVKQRLKRLKEKRRKMRYVSPSNLHKSPASNPTNRTQPTVPNQPNQSPPTPPRLCFGDFWNLYPRKRSKGQAERAWRTLQPTEQLQAQILAALERAKTSAEWAKEDGRFIPYPATWLRAKGWEDELLTPKEQAKAKLEEAMQRDAAGS